jgi:hypothetical protein
MVTIVAGCTPPGFARLEPFEVMFLQQGTTHTEVSFQYNPEENGCQTLEGFSVQLNGADSIGSNPGENKPRWPFGLGSDCVIPFAVLPRPESFGETATLTATSGGDTVLIEAEDFGRTLGARPMLAPGEVVHVGQRVQLALDPGFDRLSWGNIAVMSVQQGSALSSEWTPIEAPSAAGVLEVQLSNKLPPGPTRVEVGTDILPRITRCEGTNFCSFPGRVAVSIDVVVNTVP